MPVDKFKFFGDIEEESVRFFKQLNFGERDLSWNRIQFLKGPFPIGRQTIIPEFRNQFTSNPGEAINQLPMKYVEVGTHGQEQKQRLYIRGFFTYWMLGPTSQDVDVTNETASYFLTK